MFGRSGTGSENRVVRGGSWINNARNCRSAYRNRNQPGNRNDKLGFRLASSSHSRPIVVLEGTRAFDYGADHRDDPLDRPRRAAARLGETSP
ncbi:MAG: SUMF1/EgtB/PvdO family nonheme iron enzyme [bacterium]|nr:SUMF1/EgtB/PvdO family nonheme iron enzyme [bacterium]